MFPLRKIDMIVAIFNFQGHGIFPSRSGGGAGNLFCHARACVMCVLTCMSEKTVSVTPSVLYPHNGGGRRLLMIVRSYRGGGWERRTTHARTSKSSNYTSYQVSTQTSYVAEAQLEEPSQAASDEKGRRRPSTPASLVSLLLLLFTTKSRLN